MKYWTWNLIENTTASESWCVRHSVSCRPRRDICWKYFELHGTAIIDPLPHNALLKCVRSVSNTWRGNRSHTKHAMLYRTTYKSILVAKERTTHIDVLYLRFEKTQFPVLWPKSLPSSGEYSNYYLVVLRWFNAVTHDGLNLT
jgi:hypothetical protein